MRSAGPTFEHVPGPITTYLAADHERLEAALCRAVERPEAIDLTAYDEFRRGLLRHIGIEEKILLPAARRAREGEPLAMATRLRLDHGALAALLVPSPTPAIVAAIRSILVAHNRLEEGAGGVYEICENLAGRATAALAAQMRVAPPVPVQPHVDDPRVVAAMHRALVRAGYAPEALGL